MASDISELHPLILKRRSLRAIDPTRSIPDEVLTRMLEAARWAPSCSNRQPWRFVAVEDPEALDRARSALKRGNQTWANHAPLLIAVCANPADDYELNGQPLYLLDCGLAAENLILQGVAEGLAVHPMAGWEEDKMREALSIPDPYRVVVVIAVGYPGRLEDLPEDLQQRETAERSRKPLEELVHYNGWEKTRVHHSPE